MSELFLTMIKIYTIVSVSLSDAWKYWTEPHHITNWNFASADWHCPRAANEPVPGGTFCYTMAAKDGSAEFDFKGTYQAVLPMKKIEYQIEDGRQVIIEFEEQDSNSVKITEQFEPEQVHSEALQQQGWQSILNQFKKYAEAISN